MTATDTRPASRAERVTASPRLRRRPHYVILGAALIGVGGLTAAWAAGLSGEAQVVVAAHDLKRGETIDAGDLTTAAVAGIPAASTVPASQAASLIGLTLTTDVPGALPVPPGAATDTPVPAAGRSVVGASLPAGRLPATGLEPGANVRIVATPRSMDDPPTTAAATYRGSVVAVTPDEVSGTTAVDISVPAGQGSEVAALLATDRVSIVLDTPGGV